MAENIELNVKLNNASSIKELEKDATKAQSAFHKLHTVINENAKAITAIGVATTGLKSTLEMLSQSLGAIKNFIADGIALNAQYEDLQRGLQSLINVADKSSNISPFQKWKKSGESAKNVLSELKKMDVELDFNSKDLGEMFKSFYSTASSHMGTDEAIKAFKNIAHAAQASGADVGSLKATLDSLGAGIVQTNTDFGRFVSSMGLSTEKLKNAIADGSFSKILEESLGGFANTSEFSEKKFKALISTFEAGASELKRIAMEPLFKELKNQFEEINATLGDSSELKEALEFLGDGLAQIGKGAFNETNFRVISEALQATANAVGGLVMALNTLSDIAIPDWLTGSDDDGIFSAAARGWGDILEGLNQVPKALNNLDFDMPDFMLKATQNTNNFRQTLASLGIEVNKIGSVWHLGDDINADNVGAAIDGAKGAIKALQLNLDSLKNYKLDKVIEADIKLDLEAQIKNIGRIKAGLEDLQAKDKARTDEQIRANEAAMASNKKLLDDFLKSHENRQKSHQKTINGLIAQEEKLNQKATELIEQRARIEENWAQKRADMSLSAQEKIRKASQAGMSDTQKYNDDQLALSKRLSQAKEALNNNDLESFRRYAKEVESLNESLGAQKTLGRGDEAQTINRASEYKAIVNELLEMNLSVSEQEEAKELEAHDKKMANIEAEKQAVQAKLEQEKALYNEILNLKQQAESGSIGFDDASFASTKEKIAAITDALENGTKITISADTSAAQASKDALMATSESTHEVVADTSAAQSAINELTRDTSSTHTVYVRQVETKASGGKAGFSALEAIYRAGGGMAFRRLKDRIPGHDLSGRDDVPAMLTRGEFIQNVRAVDFYGADFMQALNQLKIPKAILPKFATGGLVNNSVNTNFINEVVGKIGNSTSKNISSDDIAQLVRELKLQFKKDMQGNYGIVNRIQTAMSWEKMYPEFVDVFPNWRGYNIDFEALAQDMLKKALNFNMNENATNLENIANLSTGVKTTRNVNLNFNTSSGASYKTQTDEATARALERYFKGIGFK